MHCSKLAPSQASSTEQGLYALWVSGAESQSLSSLLFAVLQQHIFVPDCFVLPSACMQVFLRCAYADRKILLPAISPDLEAAMRSREVCVHMQLQTNQAKVPALTMH